MATMKEWAYIAGFMDGEACFQVSRRSSERSPRVQVWMSITITQKDPTPLYWIQARIGGRIHKSTRPHGTFYSWSTQGQKHLQTVLEGIILFLVLKKPQALVLMDTKLSPDQKVKEVRKVRNNPYQPVTREE